MGSGKSKAAKEVVKQAATPQHQQPVARGPAPDVPDREFIQGSLLPSSAVVFSHSSQPSTGRAPFA
jgi:hypothetical protein